MKLTDSQLVMLSAASTREAGLVLPLPKSLKLNAGAATLVLKSLLKRRFIEEQEAGREQEYWRDDNEGKRFALAITQAGLESIGVCETAECDRNGRATVVNEVEISPKQPLRDGSKLSLLVDLLSREAGSTLEEAAEVTGWQHHSLRGAISGALKKRMGLSVASSIAEGRGRVYRIAQQ